LIEENLDLLRIPEESTEVISASAETFCGREHLLGWDIAFFDPPYDTDYGLVLFEFGENTRHLLTDDGILVVEHHSKRIIPESIGTLRRWRVLKQGETSLSFFEQG
jgi:16S rRNA G966 N2-methylase RsmD